MEKYFVILPVLVGRAYIGKKGPIYSLHISFFLILHNACSELPVDSLGLFIVTDCLLQCGVSLFLFSLKLSLSWEEEPNNRNLS